MNSNYSNLNIFTLASLVALSLHDFASGVSQKEVANLIFDRGWKDEPDAPKKEQVKRQFNNLKHDAGATLPGLSKECIGKISRQLVKEIHKHQPTAEKIIKTITEGKYKGEAYKELAKFIDKHPRRFSGYPDLEEAIDYLMDLMTALKLENVRGENVQIPKWVRGKESLKMVKPYTRNLKVLGLGNSIGTAGLTADVIVVQTFEELEEKKEEVEGKIVVYNQGWQGEWNGAGYEMTVQYRTHGASIASEFGAVAALIESITPFSLNSVHTGIQNYWKNVTKIPVASITKEDAELLSRLQAEGENIQIEFAMKDHATEAQQNSRNVFGEIKGASIPDEYVAVTAHTDNWDVGTGAMDDGGGVMISILALAVLKDLINSNEISQPRRTLQTILWTAEEPGVKGANGFVEKHMDELESYSAVFESDDGTFKPLGLDFAGLPEAGCIVQEVLKLLSSISATKFQSLPEVSSDITVLKEQGVPTLSLNVFLGTYFFYHHSEADTMSVQNSTEMDLCLAVLAVSSYVIADISEKLPRE